MSLIGILSDAHGNIEAFQSALMQLRKLGANKFYFLGDALGYIPNIAILHALREMGSTVQCIKGNHEVLILSGLNTPKSEPVYQHGHIRQELNEEIIGFFRSWPTCWRESINGVKILLVHGSPDNVTNEYVYPDTDIGKFLVREKFVFMGHSHYPFIREHCGTTYVNVGSCGLPRDDGRYGSFATFDPGTTQVLLYRYSIIGSLSSIPEDTRDRIHPSVYRLFERRTDSLVGEIL